MKLLLLPPTVPTNEINPTSLSFNNSKITGKTHYLLSLQQLRQYQKINWSNFLYAIANFFTTL